MSFISAFANVMGTTRGKNVALNQQLRTVPTGDDRLILPIFDQIVDHVGLGIIDELNASAVDAMAIVASKGESLRLQQ